MSKVKKVLIVGGGIGGLTTAIALQKVGIETEIVEKQKEWNVYGVGIILQSNALRAIDALGITEEFLAVGTTHSALHIRDSQGNMIFDAPIHPSGQFNITGGIPRRDFHEILLQAAIKNGTKIRMGITVEMIENADSFVYTKFTDGTSGTYDLVIGADGVRSKVRNMVFGDIEPTFVGQAVWRYTLKRPANLENITMFYGQKAKAGIVPMTKDSCYVFVVTAEPGNPWKQEEKLHVLMREAFQEFGGLIAELSEQITDPKEVVYRPLETLIVEKPWYLDRVLLIGDSAHATVPHLAQGAAMAIEDALVLSELLQKDEPVVDVLNEFMERRYERCKFVVDNSNTLVNWELLQLEGRLPKENNPNAIVAQSLIRMTEVI
ncbi:2-polyprenyl-6-methoxyphenol hydroxylase-like FAD-dependent oxidoreductase [Neobacillus niacini]|uniref:FAD-dependent monooxygenase n=1 Tax=Neobacillus driksii TaxID=3035913 RepID=UPI002785F0FE|nr:FAD-dependent monooxygenase [Neobacillus niacini]MDQ0972284.1 2-polyprenyl-6-methoxyphenol hydroxylase-like FAD-dependent oxidoreductase [Neobacillus niacini]